MGIGAVLAACGGTVSPSSSRATTTSPGASPGASATHGPGTLTPTGPLTFANRSGSIDLEADGVTSPTIAAFEEKYAVQVDYAGSEIEDDETFVALMRPQLEAGVEPGWDLVVVADWMAARMVAEGWAESIDPTHVPAAVANLRDELRGEPWDPTNQFHYPWLSVATGIAWNRASAARDPLRLADLFDPSMAGRVTLLREARDTLPLVHLMLQDRSAASDRPVEDMTVEDARVAIEYLRPFVDSGHVRAFTRSDGVDDLVDGTTWAAMAWSRDLAPLVGEDDAWSWPEEGWLVRSDALVIPRAAKNRYTAELMIDWVYDPARSARIALFAGSMSPVQGAAGALAGVENAPDPTSPAWPLLVPPPDVAARRHRHPVWDEETAGRIEDLFEELAGP